MSAATALSAPGNRAPSFWQSTNGKKVVMAVTGAVMFAFIIGHVAGNLQIFEGRDKINAYGHFLHSIGELLWPVRIVLLLAMALHITATVQLALRSKAARPMGYSRKEAINSSYASRTMYWSGPIVLAFIIFHLLQFTAGYIHPESQFIEGDVYHNVVAGLSGVVGFGVVHLRGEPAGPSSAAMASGACFSPLGMAHPRHTPIAEEGGAV